jgi:hypothetical protein
MNEKTAANLFAPKTPPPRSVTKDKKVIGAIIDTVAAAVKVIVGMAIICLFV